MLYEEFFDRLTVSRASNNVFNLFFDSFSGINSMQFNPLRSGVWNDVRTMSIAELLNQLVNVYPENVTPTNPVVINKIPVVRITADLLKIIQSCTICQEDFKIGEVSKMLNCEHFYHENCLVPWLQAKNTCPLCREVIN